jgi:hypothetical protein
MSNAFAVYTSNPNLLRCELHRLEGQIVLTDALAQTATVGLGSYEQNEVLLQEYSVADVHSSYSQLWRGVASDVAIMHAAEVPVGAQLERYVQPYRFRSWMFSHVGDVQEYGKFRMKLIAALPELLQRQLSSDLVSEGMFALFLKNARELGRLDDTDYPATAVVEALRRTTRQVQSYAQEAGAVRAPELNFFATNGRMLVVSRCGPKPLHYALLEGSTQCDVCGVNAQTSENQPLVISHRRQRSVAVATQTTSKASNGWLELPPDRILSVGPQLNVQQTAL